MRRTVGRLTARQVATAEPKGDRDAVLLPDGGNLYLQTTRTKTGDVNRSWVFRYELDGKRHDMGLGPLRDFSLAEARERARALRQQLHHRIDPLDAKREQKREHARDRERSDSEPGPSDKLAPDCALNARR